MTKPSTTCQICGRLIKTVNQYGSLGASETDKAAGKTDRIAHHGFQRPHQQHWQTASCFGARWRPYEVACDALPPAIDGIRRYRERLEQGLIKFLAEPPASLKHEKPRRNAYQAKEVIAVPRPAGFVFDEAKSLHLLDYPSYPYLYLREKKDYDAKIKCANDDQKSLEQRLAEWRAPAEVVA